MIGTAEDHHSNPLKIAISKFKRAGGRFISINPIRTGYSAIADEWVPIRPGTDGALFMALIHELIAAGLRPRVPRALHERGRTRRHRTKRAIRFGLFVRDPRSARRQSAVSAEPAVVGSRNRIARCRITRRGAEPALVGRYTLADGTPVTPSFALLRERVADCTPEWAADITGIPADDDPPPRARDGRRRAATRRSSCRSAGPTRGARRTRRSPATRSPSTRCADSPRIRTASRRSARSRS